MSFKFSFRTDDGRPVDAGLLGEPLGRFHDCAKAWLAFQEYLEARMRGEQGFRAPHAAPSGLAAWRWVVAVMRRANPGLTEPIASRLAEQSLPLYELLLPIVGHHAGLGAASGCVQAVLAADSAAADAGLAFMTESGLLPARLPGVPKLTGTRRDLFIRMVSSAMFDADRLDTEKHFRPDAPVLRGTWAKTAEVARRFEAEQERFLATVRERVAAGALSAAVAAPREELYRDALAACAAGPGLHRMQAPTGCAKTRAYMAYGARMVLLAADGHFGETVRFDRVIVALPFTSIIDQAAQTLRGILERDERGGALSPAVLEHHGAADPARTDGEGQSARAAAFRMAEENWDAPVILTTFVQLFESLLGNRPGQMRKLHNIARSVIVLDEVQALPTALLEPTMDVLRALVEFCGCTVVLSTATQPVFENGVEALSGFPVREMVRRPEHLFATLRRVRYEVHGSLAEPVSPRYVAELALARDQALLVFNTRRDALRVFDECEGAEGLRHLSTLLCPAHRRQVLADVRARLAQRLPVRLISTQVIEAGVDVDFPWGARAFGPLGSIGQTGGRINREGLLRDVLGNPTLGTLAVFFLQDGQMPPDEYETATRVLWRMLPTVPRMIGPDGADLGPDFADPGLLRRYYDALMALGVDVHEIQEKRRQLDFPGVADDYRLIRDEQVSFCVDWQGLGHASLAAYLAKPSRDTRRGLQDYVVQLRDKEARRAIDAGWAEETDGGIWRWVGPYDPVRGAPLAG